MCDHPTVLSLPVDLLRDRVFSLLDIRDIMHLDNAIFSHKVRQLVLPALQRAAVSGQPGHAVEVDLLSLKWLSAREICLRHADFCGGLSDLDLSENISLFNKLENAKISSCKAITDVGIATLFLECPYLCKLELFTCSSITPEALRHVKGFSLRELYVTQCSTLSDETYSELIVGCPNLEVIVVEGCDALTDTSVRVLSLICTKLREFTFKDNKLLTPESVMYIAQNCTTLKKIVGEYSDYSFDAERTNYAHQRALEHLATNNASLEHVELTVANIAAAHVSTFATLCPNLHTFVLGSTHNNLSSAIREVTRQCQSLTHLNLENLDLKREVLWGISKYCTKLQVLHLPYITSSCYDDDLASILRNNPDLHTLVAEGALQLNGEAFRTESATSSTSTSTTIGERRMPRPSATSKSKTNSQAAANTRNGALLTTPTIPTPPTVPVAVVSLPIVSHVKLNLTHVDVSECNLLQPDNLVALFKRCPKLSRLNLSCNHVDVGTITALGMHCKQLRYLDLTQCPGVDRVVLCELAALCTTLTILRLNACKASDIGLRAIVSANPNLEFLDLSWCSNMADGTIHAVATHCTKLHTLKLSSANISADAFEFLATKCVRLRKIVLRHCAFLTDQCLTILAMHCTKLEDICITDCDLITDRVLRKFAFCSPRLLKGRIENCLNVNGRYGPPVHFSASTL